MKENFPSVEKGAFNLESELKLRGRILWLTRNRELLKRQLEDPLFNPTCIPAEELAQSVSTDEIIPSKYAFYFKEEELGQFALTGFAIDGKEVIGQSEIKNGGFELIVSGPSFGCGSSREHAPIALKGAGIKFIAAEPLEKIFLANSQNQGLYPLESQSALFDFIKNKQIERETVASAFNPISADVIRFGGLLPYLKARMEGKVDIPEPKTAPRPMTLVEKIIARHWVKKDRSIGVPAVKPGDAGFIKADLRYGYELSTPLGSYALAEIFGEDYKVKDPQTIILFEDHTVLAETLRQNPQTSPLLAKLLSTQRSFAKRHQVLLYSPNVGICHNKMVESHALPGQVIPGTDSHTCSLGVVGAFAFGIGATEMAGSWLTQDVRIEVPKTWRFNFKGRLKEGVTAKDVMLHLLAGEKVKKGEAVGKVWEYGGEALNSWKFGEQFVLTNMAVEGGAFTGLVEPNTTTVFLSPNSHLHLKNVSILRSDRKAEFEEVFEIDLSKIPEMVATPGDPRNGVPLEEVEGTKVDVVYIGSCTGGKDEDLEQAAEIFSGREVKVPTYVQASSLAIHERMKKKGVISAIEKSGAQVIGIGCGDCCNLGMGIAKKGQRIVSDTNRNFPGRMGPAEVYLVNPRVAAATAVKGRIISPFEL